MDQIPGGFWRPVAEGFIQGQIKKPFFGRAYLVFGECFSLWAYMMELGGILATKHAAKPDAFVSAFLGMSGAPGVTKGVLAAQGEKMVKQRSLGSMTFWDYVAADIAERTGRTGNDWSSLVMEVGAQKTRPRIALTNSWEYASAGAALGAIHPDVVRAMFERTHAPVSKERWQEFYAGGLDIGPEPVSTSYAEAEATENKNFMEFCQQFRPELYAVLKVETNANVVIADKSIVSESVRHGSDKISEIPQAELDRKGGIKPDERIDWRKVAFEPGDVAHGAMLIRSGIHEYQSWSEQMVGKYGEAIRERLSEIYSRAEMQAAAADAMQEESYQLLGPWVWEPLEDAAWSSNAAKEDAMLALKEAYNDLKTWNPNQLRFAVEAIAAFTVKEILGAIEQLPTQVRDQCRNINNVKGALDAANAAQSAVFECIKSAAPGHPFWEIERVADQMSWAAAEACWGAMKAAWALRESALGAAKAADVAKQCGADPDDILRRACGIWTVAANWSAHQAQQNAGT